MLYCIYRGEVESEERNALYRGKRTKPRGDKVNDVHGKRQPLLPAIGFRL